MKTWEICLKSSSKPSNQNHATRQSSVDSQISEQDYDTEKHSLLDKVYWIRQLSNFAGRLNHLSLTYSPVYPYFSFYHSVFFDIIKSVSTSFSPHNIIIQEEKRQRITQKQECSHA